MSVTTAQKSSSETILRLCDAWDPSKSSEDWRQVASAINKLLITVGYARAEGRDADQVAERLLGEDPQTLIRNTINPTLFKGGHESARVQILHAYRHLEEITRDYASSRVDLDDMAAEINGFMDALGNVFERCEPLKNLRIDYEDFMRARAQAANVAARGEAGPKNLGTVMRYLPNIS